MISEKLERKLGSLYQKWIATQADKIREDKFAVMEIDQTLLRQIVQLLIKHVSNLRELGTTVQLHADGFLQLILVSPDNPKLEEEFRLHIWDPSISGGSGIHAIHKHAFTSNSMVLLGTLHDRIFDVVPLANSQSAEAFRIYETPLNKSQAPTNLIVQAQKRLERSATAGQGIHYPFGIYHIAPDAPKELIVTLFQKFDVDENREGPGNYLGPVKIPGITTKHQSIAQKDAWDLVLNALKKIKEAYGMGTGTRFS